MPATRTLSLTPSTATIAVTGGIAADFTLNIPDGSTLLGVTWVFRDADNKVVTLPDPDPVIAGKKMKGYKGARASFGEGGVRVFPGEVASYSLLTVEGTVKLQNDKTKAVTTPKVSATVHFSWTWGGMAKAWYPYPADWDVPWQTKGDRKDKGRRALLLIWDLICQLPKEIRETAGGMPILRTTNDKRLDGGKFDGAHLPFYHDAIQIADSLVQALDAEAKEITAADKALVSTVLHEISHAVTHRKAAWNLHHAFTALRNYLRKPPLGVVGAIPGGAAAGGVFLVALLKEFVLQPPDFVSGYAEAADWELNNPWARTVRLLHPVHDAFDFAGWLSRIPKKGLFHNEPLRPNFVTGCDFFGKPLGLRHRSSVDSAAISKLQNDIAVLTNKTIPRLESELPTAADPVKKQKELDDAKQRLAEKQSKLDDAFASSGFVSDYAAADVHEDIAETYTWLVFGPAALNTAGYRTYAAPAKLTGALKRRRDYLVKEKVFPAKWKPIEIGALYHGLESFPHLDNLKFEL